MAKTSKSQLCYVDCDNKSMNGVSEKHNISAMPTLVYIKDGKEVDRMEGVDRAKLDRWVDASA